MSHLPQSPRAELNTPVVPFCTCKAPLDTQLPPSLETVFATRFPLVFWTVTRMQFLETLRLSGKTLLP